MQTVWTDNPGGVLGPRQVWRPQHPTQPTRDQIRRVRCNRASCNAEWSFDDAHKWREHRGHCRRTEAAGFCCSFSACNSRFRSSDETIHHENNIHRIWACEGNPDCAAVFLYRRSALGHVLLRHHHVNAAETALRVLWTYARQNADDVSLDRRLTFDLEHKPGKEDLEAIISKPAELGSSSNRPSIGAHAVLVKHVISQLGCLESTLADTGLELESSDSQAILETLDTIRNGLQGKTELERSGLVPQKPPPAGLLLPSSAQMSRSVSSNRSLSRGRESGSRPQAQEHPSQRSSSPRTTFTYPTAVERSEEESESELSSTEPLQAVHYDKEPAQEMHLTGEQQHRYFEKIQAMCVEAAYDFYVRHHSALDAVMDKKGRRLCTTSRGVPIEVATDLSLPQWTHLLRRLSDAKGLTRDMVSQIESFNGEIQPVDEVRHAFSKAKVKSDRDLLALVQMTRSFTRQLKDWDRCAQLDELYRIIEMEIRAKKKELRDMQGFEKPRRRKSTRRRGQSLTWPRALKGVDNDEQ